VTAENLLLIAVGVVPGLILAGWPPPGSLGAFNSDLMRFQTDVRPATFALSALGVAAAALLAQIPAAHARSARSRHRGRERAT